MLRPVVKSAAIMATTPAKPPRLRFIDMARAVAILLMLEGHFVHLLLAEEWRIKGNWFHDSWLHGRGLAAPMFFTVTGLIFAFLLSGSQTNTPLLQIRRVRRGLLRVAELLFWGYLLQFNPRILSGVPIPPDSWFLTFHVLQCIAFGLLAMIAIYGLLRHVPRPLLSIAFALAGFAIFLISIPLANVDGYLPPGWPPTLQNPIHGPGSHFPLSPWLAFTFYGAAVGVYSRHHQQGPKPSINPLVFLLPGLVLANRGWPWDGRIGRALLDLCGITGDDRVVPVFLHGRLGETLVILGLLVAFERYVKLNTSRFETIGRNTFPIYITHVIILYGGIFGIGLNTWKHSLDPWQAAIGAITFCAFFAIIAQFVEPTQKWTKARLAHLRGKPSDGL